MVYFGFKSHFLTTKKLAGKNECFSPVGTI